MARPRKRAEDLVPEESPLEHVAAAEDGAADEAGEPDEARPTARTPGTREARPKKRTKRAPSSGERRAIVRLPKPEHERGRRKERRGVVVSSAMEKTIVVRVETVKPDPRYKKVVRRSRKFHAHDERNEANVGDVVRIVETRPLSKTKTWRLAEVVQAAR